jgi:hypothetical protein
MTRVPVRIDGRPAPAGAPQAIVNEVSPDYHATIGVPIVRGRGFLPGDRPIDSRAATFAAIVNETFARLVFQDSDPIGQRVISPLPGAGNLGDRTFEIVGVARDYRQERAPQPLAPVMHVYVPLGSSNTPLVVRTSAPDPTSIVPDIRAIVKSIDPGLRVAVAQTFGDAVARGLSRERLHGRVLGVFAILAVTMAVAGLYGVISYAVALRRREFGVRLALGASRRQLLGLVVGSSAVLTAAGIAAGLGGAVALTRLISDVLYGIPPTDPLTFAAATAAVAVLALLAVIVPAQRAASVDPVVTLRVE